MSQIINVWDGVQNTNSWVHDGDVERSAVDIVELANQVSGYVVTAQQAASNASDSAEAAAASVASIGTAATDAIADVQAEGATQIGLVQTEGTTQTGLVTTAGTNAVSDVRDEGTAQVALVSSEGSTQIGLVQTEGTTQTGLVSAAGSSAIGSINSATSSQITAITTAGSYQAGLVATEGGTQIAAVKQEGADQRSALIVAVNAQVSEATNQAIAAGNSASTASSAALAAQGYSSDASDYATAASGYATAAGNAQTAAGNAQTAAENAQTAAENAAASVASEAAQIATNAANITALGIKTDITNHEVDNIQALLKGNLYTEQTDSTVAYAKTVPTGALPWAEMQYVGGKTVVWNQLNNNGNVTQTKNNVTFTNNGDGSWTITGKPTARAYIYTHDGPGTSASVTVVYGHKYIQLVHGAPSGVNTGGSWYNGTTYAGSANSNAIITPPQNADRFTCGLIDVTATLVDVDLNFTMTTCFIDLTLLYGDGNEPTTVAEFEAMSPNPSTAYDAGSLMSAGVTQWVSRGQNLWNMMSPWYYGNNFYNMAVGYTFSPNTPSITITDNGDGSFSFTPGTNWYGCIFIAELVQPFATESVKVTATISSTDTRTSLYCLDANYKVLYSYNDTTNNQTWSRTIGGVSTAYPDTKYVAMAIGTTTANAMITVTQPMIQQVKPVATDYIPYHKSVYPVPVEVQALPGYGWSAGTAYNYIDFERKVFVQNVDRANLGSFSWSYNTSSGHERFRSSGVYDYIEPPADGNTMPNIVCASYVTSTSNQVYNHSKEKIITCETGKWLGCYDASFNGDADAFTIAMNGVYLYYQLATPIETDISAYLDDESPYTNVEAGGSITFENVNGSDYRIPVPSAITYDIDTQAAL